ncbi:MAG: 30S ribosomal protein S3ae [Thermoplasmata archaeon]|nr:30S ribosomal protein S3ae [Thermoplasmata archaeon]
MPAPKTKAKGRATKDKWKSKVWYDVMAPDMFNRQKVAETMTDESEKLMGRIAEVTVQDINGDFSKMHIKLRFKVNDVRGTEAHTYFVGHDMSSDYVRRMTRRRKSKIDLIVDTKTRDDFIIRLKPLAISGNRIRSSQQSAIRHIITTVIKDFCSTRPLDEIVKAIISGQLAKMTASACKPIHPLQRVEIHKSEILKAGFIPAIPDAPEEEEPVAAEPTEEAPAEAPQADESEVIEESEEIAPEPPVE